MKRKYKNPPIIEAVCEFRLSQDIPWDSSSAQKIAVSLTGDFPIKEVRQVQEVQLGPDPNDSKFTQMQFRTGEIIALYNLDRSKLIQIGSRMFAINRLKPYLGWKSFSADIENLIKIMQINVDPKTFQRVGLRYINQIELSQEFVNDYLKPIINIGTELDQKIDKFETAFSLSMNKTDHCKLQFNKIISPTFNRQIHYIDIDYFLYKPFVITINNAMDWVQSAHSQIYEIFERCITDKTRALFTEEHDVSA